MSLEQWTPFILLFCTVNVSLIAWFMVRLVKQQDKVAEKSDERLDALEIELAVMRAMLKKAGLYEPDVISITQRKSGA